MVKTQSQNRDFTAVVTEAVLKQSHERMLKTLGAAAPKKIFKPYARKIDMWLTMNQSDNYMLAAHELYKKANYNSYVLAQAHATIYELYFKKSTTTSGGQSPDG